MINLSRVERFAFDALHGADGAADALRALEHGRRIQQGLALAGVRIFEALDQSRAHGLA